MERKYGSRCRSAELTPVLPAKGIMAQEAVAETVVALECDPPIGHISSLFCSYSFSSTFQ